MVGGKSSSSNACIRLPKIRSIFVTEDSPVKKHLSGTAEFVYTKMDDRLLNSLKAIAGTVARPNGLWLTG